MKLFRAPIYWAHRAVVFAIARLSCSHACGDPCTWQPCNPVQCLMSCYYHYHRSGSNILVQEKIMKDYRRNYCKLLCTVKAKRNYRRGSIQYTILQVATCNAIPYHVSCLHQNIIYYTVNPADDLSQPHRKNNSLWQFRHITGQVIQREKLNKFVLFEC